MALRRAHRALAALAAACAAGVLIRCLGPRVLGTGAIDGAGGDPQREGRVAPTAASDRAADSATLAARPAIPLSAHARLRVTGMVVDAGGRPVPGARVIAYAEDLDRVASFEEAAPSKGPVRGATTEGDGRFAIDLGRDPTDGDDADPSFLSVVADAPGFAAAGLDGVRAGDDVRIALAPALALAGFVRDLDGRPVAGAVLRWSGPVRGALVARSATSATDGTYRIEGIRGGKAHDFMDLRASVLEVSAEGFAPLALPAAQATDPLRARPGPDGAVRFDVWLPRGAKIRGRVLDAASGGPLADACVFLWGESDVVNLSRPAGGELYNPAHLSDTCRATSAADGTFALEHVPSHGVHRTGSRFGSRWDRRLGWVAAVPEGHAPTVVAVNVPDEGAVVVVELRCARAGRVRGRVVDARGTGVAGAGVWYRVGQAGVPDAPAFVEGFPARWVRAGADGRYELAAVPAGEAASNVTVHAAGPTDGSRTLGTAETGPVAVPAGGVLDVPDLVLSEAPPALRAVFRVTDGAGVPIPGARVEPEAGAARRTGEDGRARVVFDDWGVGVTRHARVRAPGFAAVTVGGFTPSTDRPPEVVVALVPPHRLRGRVMWTDGSPAEAVSVEVGDGSHPIDRVFPASKKDLAFAEFVHATLRTGPDGSFQASDLPEGPWHVRACAAKDILVASVPTDTVELSIVVEARKAPARSPTRAVECVVTDAATGEPVPRSEARLRDGDRDLAWAVPFAPGVLRFAEVPYGTWTLVVESPNFDRVTVPDMRVDAEGPVPSLEVRLDAGAVLRGVLSDASGAPMPSAKVHAEAAGAPTRTGDAIPGGAYEVRGLRPGSGYTLSVATTTGPTGSTTGPVWWVPQDGGRIDLPAASREVVRDVRLVAATGILVEIDCARLPSGSVKPTEEQARVSAASRLTARDAAGRIAWERTGLERGEVSRVLALGEYVVRVEIPGAPPEERPVRLVAREYPRLTFTIP